MARSTSGPYIQRMLDGITLSENERRRVERRDEEVRNRARASRMRRLGMSGDYQFDPLTESIAQQHVNDDHEIGVAVGNEQWGQRLTVMYGIAHLVAESQRVREQLDTLIELQRTTNQILSRLVPQNVQS